MIVLDNKNRDMLHSIFKKHAVFKHAYYFGSRAKGTNRPDSDIDICLKCPMNTLNLSALKEDISNSNITLKTDIIVWDDISTGFQQKIIHDLTPMDKTQPKKRLTNPETGKPFTGEWEEKILGDIGDTYSGLSGKSQEDFGHGKPFVQYMQVFSGKNIDLQSCRLVNIEPDEKQNKIHYGDILFTTSSETPLEVGMSLAVLETFKELYLNSFCFGYRLNNNVKYSPEFMHFLFKSNFIRKKITKLAQGITRFNLSKTNFLKLNVLLPELLEQQAIADCLSDVDLLIEKQTEKLATLKNHKQGLMQTLFPEKGKTQPAKRLTNPKTGKPFSGDWEEKKLGDVCQKGSSAFTMSDVNDNGKYNIYGASGICGKVDDYISSEDYIGIVKDGSGVGKIYFCEKETAILGTLQQITLSNNGNNIAYMYYLMQTINFEKYIIGGAIPHIYFKDYSKEKIYTPELQEQKKIAGFLSAVDLLIEKQTEKLATLKNYKQGLMQQLFPMV